EVEIAGYAPDTVGQLPETPAYRVEHGRTQVEDVDAFAAPATQPLDVPRHLVAPEDGGSGEGPARAQIIEPRTRGLPGEAGVAVRRRERLPRSGPRAAVHPLPEGGLVTDQSRVDRVGETHPQPVGRPARDRPGVPHRHDQVGEMRAPPREAIETFQRAAQR